MKDPNLYIKGGNPEADALAKQLRRYAIESIRITGKPNGAINDAYINTFVFVCGFMQSQGVQSPQLLDALQAYRDATKPRGKWRLRFDRMLTVIYGKRA